MPCNFSPLWVFYFNKINESFRLDLVYVYFMPKQLYLRVLYI